MILNDDIKIDNYEHKINVGEHYKITRNIRPSERIDVEIKRYLITDDFSIKAWFFSSIKRTVVFDLQINGQVVETSQPFYLEPGEHAIATFIAPTIKKELSKVDKLVVVVRDMDVSEIMPIIVAEYDISLNDYQRDYFLDDNNIIIFQIPYSVRLSNYGSRIYNKQLSLRKIQYITIEIKKTKWNRYKHNKELFTYKVLADKSETDKLSLDYGTSPDRQVKFQVSKVKNDQIVQENQIRPIFEWFKFENEMTGTAITNSNFHYDWSDNKVKVGASSRSKQGLLIPYNFQGDFKLSFNLSINAALNDLKIDLQQNFPRKVIDPYSGQVRLLIKESIWNPKETNVVKSGIISHKEWIILTDNDIMIDGINQVYSREKYDRETNQFKN